MTPAHDSFIEETNHKPHPRATGFSEMHPTNPQHMQKSTNSLIHPNRKGLGLLTALSLSLTLIANFAGAQPSGGPYGPQPQSYPIPEIEGTLYYVAPDGDTAASGTSLEQATTLENAIERVKSGDAIVLRGGIYRTGDLKLNQNILMQPYLAEAPVIKGTFVATDWVDQVPERYKNRFPALWATQWEHLFPSAPDDWWRAPSAGRETRLHKFNNDLLFINGRMLQSTDWFEGLNDDTFYIDYDKKTVYLSSDPTGKEIEITAFNQGLVVTSQEVHGKKADKQGPTIRGISFSQYAFHILEVDGYFPNEKAAEADMGKVIVGTTIEHCSFTYAGRVGAFVFGDHLTMRHCLISDTSTEGLYVFSSADVLLEKNIFTRNNVEQITGYYPAAVKIFNQTHRVTCNDNLIIDLPYSNGVWYDVGNVDGIFTNNWVENVGCVKGPFANDHVWPSQNGLFFEISQGVVVAGNVFVNDDHGILILNSREAEVFNNTFINSMACFARDSRGDGADHFGWHVTTGPGVDERDYHAFYNNILMGDADFQRPLLLAWQPENMCERLTTPSLQNVRSNTYIQLNQASAAPLIMLNQKLGETCVTALDSLDAIHASIPGYGANSVVLTHARQIPFQSYALKRFEPTPTATTLSTPAPITAAAAKAASMDPSVSYIGAYPLK